MIDEIAMTSPDPVDIKAIAPIVKIRIPPEEPSIFSAIRGVTKPEKYKFRILWKEQEISNGDGQQFLQ